MFLDDGIFWIMSFVSFGELHSLSIFVLREIFQGFLFKCAKQGM